MIFGSTEISALRVGGSEVSKVYLGSVEVWSSAFDPLSLSPEIWFDASDSSTLYDATSGGSLVAADGTIARWEDKSGNARHATQGTSGARPTRKTAIKNGLDIARFDGSDWMVTAAFGGTESFETHVVFASRVNQTAILAGWSSGAFTPNPGACYIAIIGSDQLECLQSGSGDPGQTSHRYSSSNIATADSWLAFNQRCNGTHAGHVIRSGGSDLSTSGGYANEPGTFTKTSTAFGIAAWNNGGLPARCDIAELIHVNRNLTTDERTALEAYLMAKWGI